MTILIFNDNEHREIENEDLQSNGSVHSINRISMGQDSLSLDMNTNATSSSITDLHGNQEKRHIMISYNRSSIDICRKICHHLVERNYKVWMDFEHMLDDLLARMARAVENSYIILLCINREYYESDYCRLEAEYAAKKRIKLIPCLMEEAFRPISWLGILKGSNVHIDFSLPNNFNQSFAQLIRQINLIEKKLSFQSHHTPTSNPIVHKYNQSTNHLLLYELIHRTLEQNEILLKLADHLTRQQERRYSFDVNNIIKTVLTMILLWLFMIIIFCQNKFFRTFY